jgi:hypothetical protein
MASPVDVECHSAYCVRAGPNWRGRQARQAFACLLAAERESAFSRAAIRRSECSRRVPGAMGEGLHRADRNGVTRQGDALASSRSITAYELVFDFTSVLGVATAETVPHANFRYSPRT